MNMALAIPSKNISTTALVVEAPGAPFRLQEVILDEVRSHELLIEVKYSGICHTDIVVQQGGMPVGDYPAVLGHEGAGIIRKIGHEVHDKTLSIGDLVLLSFCTCKNCKACRAGRNGGCIRMTEINFGGARGLDVDSPIRLPDGRKVRGQFFGQSCFSQLTIVDERSVVPCPDLSLEELAFVAPLGCGYLTGAGTVLNVLKPNSGEKIAIIGIGAVGLSALMVASAQGAEVIAIDIVDEKLELAKSLGAIASINPKNQGDLRAAIKAIAPQGVEFVIDTTGIPQLIQDGVAVLAHEGILAMVGVPAPGRQLEFEALDFLLSCKRLIGVIEGSSNPQKIVPQLLQLYKEGLYPVDKLGVVYPISSLEQAIAYLKAGKVIKPVLTWDAVRPLHGL